MYHDTFPDDPLYVLVDYFGTEVTDSLAVCRRFPELAAEGRLGVRLDTHGGRFVEGLDTAKSYAVLDRHVPEAIRTYRTDDELRWLTGTGVTAAAIYHLREKLDEAGFDKVKLIASSGLQPVQVQADGERQGADRRHRHRLLPARELERDLRHRRRHRL